MTLRLPLVARDRRERVIGIARVAVAATSLLAIYLDPAEPQRFVSLTYGLHAAYLAYAIVVAALTWRHDGRGRWPVATHVVDIAAGSVFQYLTLGPSSPLFMYFTFALASSALRWGSRGTLRTAALVISAYVVMGLSLTQALGPVEFELNRFIIRIGYLALVAMVLIYLGHHEEQLRAEMTMLARWPGVDVRRHDRGVPGVLAHAASIVQAPRALILWSRDDEPWLYAARHPPEGARSRRYPPDALDPVVADALSGGPFSCIGPVHETTQVITSRDGGIVTWPGCPVHRDLLPLLEADTLGAAPFRTEHISGWAFFPGMRGSGATVLPLLEVVGREIGTSLDQAIAYDRGRELAVSEDRVTRARDLHDGILQSLTGVRLELQALATGRDLADGSRLLALERALALEQRELRRVIDPERQSSSETTATGLAGQLGTLARRMTGEWRAPVSVRVMPPDLAVSEDIGRAVRLLVHEAVVNALKHAMPSRVLVEVSVRSGTLTIGVIDDGHGFAFQGTRSHEELESSGLGPVSLRERVASLGGRLSVHSSPTGARLEVTLPLAVMHDA